MNSSSNHPNQEVSPYSSGSLAGPVLTYGCGIALLVWTAWFITHLPWLGLPESVAMPTLLAVWFIAAAAVGWRTGPKRAWAIGLGSGSVTALLGLLILGSKLSDPGAAGPVSTPPSAGLIAIGFLVLGAAIGLVGGAVGSLLPGSGRDARHRPDWLARFAWVAAAAVTPLLFVGGLVTSTNSGMAVPDWPNTYGANMFLYPLGPRAAPDIFLEHAHRLFGSLVGLITLTLTVYIVRSDARRWVRFMAFLAFGLVVVQGVLGGGRVLLGSTELAQDNRFLAMLHGILAQLVFGLIVALAVVLGPTFRRGGCPASAQVPGGRAARFWTTGLLHAALLQLVLGAAYRHLRGSHALWTHAAFSIIVVIFAFAAGFALLSLGNGEAGRAHLRRTGRLILTIVFAQFALGWAAFAVSGPNHEAASTTEALIRTGHQANGALLLATATAAFVWVRRLIAPAEASAGSPLPSAA